MRLIDLDREQSVRRISIYLTPDEAKWMWRELGHLLKDPEANEHFHVSSLDNSEREISCSILTKAKSQNLTGYNRLEQRILSEE